MTDETIKVGVIGHPIGHSKSPLIHNYWIERENIDAQYSAIDIAPDDLKSGVQKLIDDGYKGFNVTIPHKEAMFDLCDECDSMADICGAVNTVVIKDGKLYGYNTDSFGFLSNITQAYPDFEFEDSVAVVFGAGGAARAIVSGLIGQRVSEVILVNRTIEKAEKIADEVGLGTDLIECVAWDDRHDALKWADLVVNTTSLGMAGQPPLDIDLTTLDDDALVNDIVYAPLETPLLKAAKSQGNRTVTGIGMLLHQARPAFHHWFGIMPNVDEDLEKRVLA